MHMPALQGTRGSVLKAVVISSCVERRRFVPCCPAYRRQAKADNTILSLTPQHWSMGRYVHCHLMIQISILVTEPIMWPFWTHNIAAYVVVNYWFHSIASPTFGSLLDP